ncbi:hypothetical protein JCM10450v2_005955 [Rhodotorula kratochvilovae]
MLPRARYPLLAASRRFTTARPTLVAASLHPDHAPLHDTGPGGHTGGGAGGGGTAVWVAGGLVAAAVYLKWGREAKAEAPPKKHHDATHLAMRNRDDALPLRRGF